MTGDARRLLLKDFIIDHSRGYKERDSLLLALRELEAALSPEAPKLPCTCGPPSFPYQEHDGDCPRGLAEAVPSAPAGLNFRKKPVVIQAMRFNPDELQLPFQHDGVCCFADGEWFINTLEGRLRLTAGDMVIRGVKGEYYPCKPDIFAATYEPEDTP